jgi:hypothetical protein
VDADELEESSAVFRSGDVDRNGGPVRTLVDGTDSTADIEAKQQSLHV